ncbi:MAG: hypothetical protein OXB84_09385 [Halobacteriovoraceae bacterium]|nr:hypothetical protein [Halobacteriovoraceae bacterium]
MTESVRFIPLSFEELKSKLLQFKDAKKILLWNSKQSLECAYKDYNIVKKQLQLDLKAKKKKDQPPKGKFFIKFELKTGQYFTEASFVKKEKEYFTVEIAEFVYKGDRRQDERLLAYPHYQVHAFFKVEEEKEGENLLFINKRSSNEADSLQEIRRKTLLQEFSNLGPSAQELADNYMGFRVVDLSSKGISFLVNNFEKRYFKDHSTSFDIILNLSGERYNLSEGKIVYMVNYIYGKARNVTMYKIGMQFAANKKLNTTMKKYRDKSVESIPRGFFKEFSKKLTLFLLIFLGAACATGQQKIPETLKVKFDLTDKHGQYLVQKERGHLEKNKKIVTKKQIIGLVDGGKKILEKSISISRRGHLKGRLSILRPEISQYTVWFKGKKYFSELKLNPGKKGLDIRLISPEQQWNGIKTIPFPERKGIYCFFEQVIECVKATNFIDTAIRRKTGSMKLFIIWNGHPYFQEQYENIPDQVFSKAVFEYDGQHPRNGTRFTLQIAGQSIFYFLDDKKELLKKFWISQGLTMVKSDIQ